MLPKLPFDKETLRKKWPLYILLAVFLISLGRELTFLGSHFH